MHRPPKRACTHHVSSDGSCDEAVATTVRLLLNPGVRCMAVCGAGISVAAGIPDFRSFSGIYKSNKYTIVLPKRWRSSDLFNLNKYLANPSVLLTFLKSLNMPDCNPTKVHDMFGALMARGILVRCYSQNIDGLELRSCPEQSVVFLHGRLPSSPLDWNNLDQYIVFNKQPSFQSPFLYSDMLTSDILLILGTSLTARSACDIVSDFQGHRILITTDDKQKLPPRRCLYARGTDTILLQDVQMFATHVLRQLD